MVFSAMTCDPWTRATVYLVLSQNLTEDLGDNPRFQQSTPRTHFRIKHEAKKCGHHLWYLILCGNVFVYESRRLQNVSHQDLHHWQVVSRKTGH